MNIRILQAAFLSVLSAVLLSACSTKGPDIIDPASNERRQVSLFGTDSAGISAELLLYSEQKGIVSTGDFAQANNGEQLGRAVDAIYENSGRIFLHHRDDGSISVLDLQTRRRLGTIVGFPSGLEGQLSGMAFSNMSQGWVICYGSPNLYEIDQQNIKIAHQILLPYSPTSVGTVKRTVFVGMEGPDKTGKVAVLYSNPLTLAVEQTLDFPSPIIYMYPTADSTQCIMLSAGGNGTGPKVYYVDVSSLTVVDEYELPTGDLTSYIGREPNYAGYTRDDYLYLALPSMVLQYDTQGFDELEFLPGSYAAIAVDYSSGLLYAYDADRRLVLRRTFEEEELADVAMPASVRAIRFFGSNRVIP